MSYYVVTDQNRVVCVYPVSDKYRLLPRLLLCSIYALIICCNGPTGVMARRRCNRVCPDIFRDSSHSRRRESVTNVDGHRFNRWVAILRDYPGGPDDVTSLSSVER